MGLAKLLRTVGVTEVKRNDFLKSLLKFCSNRDRLSNRRNREAVEKEEKVIKIVTDHKDEMSWNVLTMNKDYLHSKYLIRYPLTMDVRIWIIHRSLSYFWLLGRVNDPSESEEQPKSKDKGHNSKS